METLTTRFDAETCRAAFAYYGVPENTNRTFAQSDKINPKDGKPYLTAMPPSVAARAGKASWVQLNGVTTGAAMNPYGPKKATNADIENVLNVNTDFEYPPDPAIAHQIGIELAEILVTQGLAESGLPVEDSGAGSHIVIPIVPILTSEHGGGELVNRAIAEIVHQFIEPEFNRLAEKYGLAGKIKLEGYDISRILSSPGTFRPGGSKPNEAAQLKPGYLRCWLPPFDGDNHPVRNESEALSALIKAVCINLEAEEEDKEKAKAFPVSVHPNNGKHDITPTEWLQNNYIRYKKTGDRSLDFNALVWACYLKFDAKAVEDYADLIDSLTGGKYGKRAASEALRSCKKAQQVPKTSQLDWYNSRAYTYQDEPKISFNIVKTDTEKTSAPPSAPPTPTASTTLEPFKLHHLTDMGNARRLVERFGDFLRYVEEWGWLVWDGRRWKIDRTGAAERYAKRTVATIYSEAGQEEDAEKRKEISDWARKSEAKAKLDALLELAQSELEVRATPEEFDREPLLLNCLNGTLDLRTGQLYEHRRDDKFTKLVPVAYDPTATAPTWLKFLDRIMANNQGLITYLKRATGYTLTGLVTEHCLFFLYGSGKNGKSTFTQTLLEMLGDYQIKSPTSMVMIKRNEGIPNDLARLAGVRLTVTAEVEDGQRLAESLIKDLTGGDIVTARYLRKEYFDFQPTHKLWMFGNHKPQIRGTDEGIWRRIKLIPFNQFITPEERDPDLGQKLKAELSGILTWAVQGCQEWRFDGMAEPAEVIAATQTYRAEMDALASFIGDCCVTGVNNKVKASDLYQEYQKWCTTNNEFTLSARKFSARMTERGFHSDRGTGGHYQWKGISLLLDESDFLESMGVSEE